MTAGRLVVVPALGALALALAGCGGSSNASVTTTTQTTTTTTIVTGDTLDATVGPGFTISLTGPDGKAVTTLTAGTYTIKVDDKSDAHNFRLKGAGVDRSTDVSTTGIETWTVQLKDGTYEYACDPHPFMHGSFTVSG